MLPESDANIFWIELFITGVKLPTRGEQSVTMCVPEAGVSGLQGVNKVEMYQAAGRWKD